MPLMTFNLSSLTYREEILHGNYPAGCWKLNENREGNHSALIFFEFRDQCSRNASNDDQVYIDSSRELFNFLIQQASSGNLSIQRNILPESA